MDYKNTPLSKDDFRFSDDTNFQWAGDTAVRKHRNICKVILINWFIRLPPRWSSAISLFKSRVWFPGWAENFKVTTENASINHVGGVIGNWWYFIAVKTRITRNAVVDHWDRNSRSFACHQNFKPTIQKERDIRQGAKGNNCYGIKKAPRTPRASKSGRDSPPKPRSRLGCGQWRALPNTGYGRESWWWYCDDNELLDNLGNKKIRHA